MDVRIIINNEVEIKRVIKINKMLNLSVTIMYFILEINVFIILEASLSLLCKAEEYPYPLSAYKT
jgi:hypothetical protein